MYTGKQSPTFRRLYNPSKLKPVEVGILESLAFRLQNLKVQNPLGILQSRLYVYIYIYIIALDDGR